MTGKEVCDALRKGVSLDEMSRTSGVSYTALRSRAYRHRREHVEPKMKQEDQRPLDEITEIDRVRRQRDEAIAAIERLRREKMDAEGVMERVYGHAAYTPKMPQWTGQTGNNNDVPSGVRGTPVLVMADWHYGEVVEPDEVDGLNEFNTNICYRRVRKLVESSIDIAIDHMGGPSDVEYPGMAVCLGGDFICGDIHDELAITSERTPQQCVNDLTDIMYEALSDLQDAFGRLYVPCVVGNHGRGTLKPRCKGRIHTSHEWNIYCNLQRALKNNPNIQFHIPTQTDARFSVNGHRFLLTHGDAIGVKGGDGIIGSIGPIKRGAIKLMRQEAQTGRPVDTVVMGHWHTRISIKGVTVTGTLKGYDEYARVMLRAEYERPSQELMFVHPRYGIVPSWPIYVDESPAMAESFPATQSIA